MVDWAHSILDEDLEAVEADVVCFCLQLIYAAFDFGWFECLLVLLCVLLVVVEDLVALVRMAEVGDGSAPVGVAGVVGDFASVFCSE